jgi:hypothetical protein
MPRRAPPKPVVENFDTKKKCSGWVMWVLIALAIVVAISLGVWFYMSRSKGSAGYENLEMSAQSSGGKAEEDFGFRFY